MPQGWASQHTPTVWFLKVDCEATAPNQALARTKGIRCRGVSQAATIGAGCPRWRLCQIMHGRSGFSCNWFHEGQH